MDIAARPPQWAIARTKISTSGQIFNYTSVACLHSENDVDEQIVSCQALYTRATRRGDGDETAVSDLIRDQSRIITSGFWRNIWRKAFDRAGNSRPPRVCLCECVCEMDFNLLKKRPA